MAKKDKNLVSIDEVEVSPQNTEPTKKSSSPKAKAKRVVGTRSKQRVSRKGGRKVVIEKQNVWKKIAKFFVGLKAELKEVTWPPFKSTAKVKGVWANTGVVLMVVLFFLVIITAFDMGLAQLFRLLVGKAG